MIAYGDLFFFYILFLVVMPAIVLGFLGKSIKYYGFMATILMAAVLIGKNETQTLYFFIFYFFEIILIKLYFYIKKKTKSSWVMRSFVFLSILPIIIVKVSPHFTNKTVGFIGISYITFRIVQIIIETYDGLIENMNFVDITYFLLYFPSLSSGPIDRSRSFKENINKKIEGEIYVSEYFNEGIFKIFKGISYKFLFANFINSYWLTKIPAEHTFINSMNYMYAYTLYLFFDFAGYSSIAIGTSYLFGVKLPENFNAPFLSRNMKEFWNRWHMSLSFWFRDFVYTRFVMSSLRKKRFKSRYTAAYLGNILTMVTMGIWHGVKIFYIVYGFYMAGMLIFTDYFQRKSKLYKKYKNAHWWKVVAIFVNFHVVALGLFIFSGYLYNR